MNELVMNKCVKAIVLDDNLKEIPNEILTYFDESNGLDSEYGLLSIKAKKDSMNTTSLLDEVIGNENYSELKSCIAKYFTESMEKDDFDKDLQINTYIGKLKESMYEKTSNVEFIDKKISDEFLEEYLSTSLSSLEIQDKIKEKVIEPKKSILERRGSLNGLSKEEFELSMKSVTEIMTIDELREKLCDKDGNLIKFDKLPEGINAQIYNIACYKMGEKYPNILFADEEKLMKAFAEYKEKNGNIFDSMLDDADFRINFLKEQNLKNIAYTFVPGTPDSFNSSFPELTDNLKADFDYNKRDAANIITKSNEYINSVVNGQAKEISEVDLAKMEADFANLRKSITQKNGATEKQYALDDEDDILQLNNILDKQQDILEKLPQTSKIKDVIVDVIEELRNKIAIHVLAYESYKKSGILETDNLITQDDLLNAEKEYAKCRDWFNEYRKTTVMAVAGDSNIDKAKAKEATALVGEKLGFDQSETLINMQNLINDPNLDDNIKEAIKKCGMQSILFNDDAFEYNTNQEIEELQKNVKFDNLDVLEEAATDNTLFFHTHLNNYVTLEDAYLKYKNNENNVELFNNLLDTINSTVLAKNSLDSEFDFLTRNHKINKKTEDSSEKFTEKNIEKIRKRGYFKKSELEALDNELLFNYTNTKFTMVDLNAPDYHELKEIVDSISENSNKGVKLTIEGKELNSDEQNAYIKQVLTNTANWIDSEIAKQKNMQNKIERNEKGEIAKPNKFKAINEKIGLLEQQKEAVSKYLNFDFSLSENPSNERIKEVKQAYIDLSNVLDNSLTGRYQKAADLMKNLYVDGSEFGIKGYYSPLSLFKKLNYVLSAKEISENFGEKTKKELILERQSFINNNLETIKSMYENGTDFKAFNDLRKKVEESADKKYDFADKIYLILANKDIKLNTVALSDKIEEYFATKNPLFKRVKNKDVEAFDEIKKQHPSLENIDDIKAIQKALALENSEYDRFNKQVERGMTVLAIQNIDKNLFRNEIAPFIEKSGDNLLSVDIESKWKELGISDDRKEIDLDREISDIYNNFIESIVNKSELGEELSDDEKKFLSLILSNEPNQEAGLEKLLYYEKNAGDSGLNDFYVNLENLKKRYPFLAIHEKILNGEKINNDNKELKEYKRQLKLWKNVEDKINVELDKINPMFNFKNMDRGEFQDFVEKINSKEAVKNYKMMRERLENTNRLIEKDAYFSKFFDKERNKKLLDAMAIEDMEENERIRYLKWLWEWANNFDIAKSWISDGIGSVPNEYSFNKTMNIFNPFAYVVNSYSLVTSLSKISLGLTLMSSAFLFKKLDKIDEKEKPIYLGDISKKLRSMKDSTAIHAKTKFNLLLNKIKENSKLKEIINNKKINDVSDLAKAINEDIKQRMDTLNSINFVNKVTNVLKDKYNSIHKSKNRLIANPDNGYYPFRMEIHDVEEGIKNLESLVFENIDHSAFNKDPKNIIDNKERVDYLKAYFLNVLNVSKELEEQLKTLKDDKSFKNKKYKNYRSLLEKKIETLGDVYDILEHDLTNDLKRGVLTQEGLTKRLKTLQAQYRNDIANNTDYIRLEKDNIIRDIVTNRDSQKLMATLTPEFTNDIGKVSTKYYELSNYIDNYASEFLAKDTEKAKDLADLGEDLKLLQYKEYLFNSDDIERKADIMSEIALNDRKFLELKEELGDIVGDLFYKKGIIFSSEDHAFLDEGIYGIEDMYLREYENAKFQLEEQKKREITANYNQKNGSDVNEIERKYNEILQKQEIEYKNKKQRLENMISLMVVAVGAPDILKNKNKELYEKIYGENFKPQSEILKNIREKIQLERRRKERNKKDNEQQNFGIGS